METRLTELRERRGLTQEQLARKVGTSRGQIANLESGKRGMTLEWMRRLARALDCSVADVLTDADVPNRPNASETMILEQFRVIDGYDPAVLIVAVRAIIDAAKRMARDISSRDIFAGGGQMMAEQMSAEWSALSEADRARLVQMARLLRTPAVAA